ncbi:MAG: hypothetical protein ACRENJ_00780 [Candidatus Eiseniibacteriota bacterium]
MPRTHPGSDDAALRAALALGLDLPVGADARRLANFLAQAFGPATVALLHYGSHAQSDQAGPDSAWDFFVIVEGYLPAYRALAHALPRGFPARRGALLNRLLPPNVISVAEPAADGGRVAKCCVLSARDLARACSPRPADHFVRARLFQQVHLAWARDAFARDRVTNAIVAAREGTFAWGRPFLPARFDTRSYGRRLLEISYAAEIRPEAAQHVDVLLDAQGGTLMPMFGTLLAHLAAHGALTQVGDDYHDVRPPGAPARALARAWFRWSKARATLRWLKYVALYDDWLDYVVRKIERRSGVRFELSDRERRWPLLFLWPKAVRFIVRRRPERGR